MPRPTVSPAQRLAKAKLMAADVAADVAALQDALASGDFATAARHAKALEATGCYVRRALAAQEA
jgi:hypothetical protein